MDKNRQEQTKIAKNKPKSKKIDKDRSKISTKFHTLYLSHTSRIWSIYSLLCPISVILRHSVPKLDMYESKLEPAQHVNQNENSKILSLGGEIGP